ncbi:hypothetical protein N0V90_000293 [Kalmusia sp. IMI 367209]|nr:hypothetical protein N0V90_000293 [Kalmusia sp. IMI 367209]
MAASGQPKPTLLAFHGSGSNGTIHTVQLARLSRFLKPYFEIESLTAPLPSSAGPGILPFFDGCGPYYRWIPPTEALSTTKMREHTATMLPSIEDLVRTTVSNIRAKGGKVVGLIGFSQGTRVVAGLLKGSQIREALVKEGKDAGGLEWLDFKFALSVCSSSPPLLVPPSVVDALSASGLEEARQAEVLDAKVEVPTLHVLGNQDEWRWAGKLLIETVYAAGEEVQAGKVSVYEFSMGHHYPVQPDHTQKLVDWMLGTWEVVKQEA